MMINLSQIRSLFTGSSLLTHFKGTTTIGSNSLAIRSNSVGCKDLQDLKDEEKRLTDNIKSYDDVNLAKEIDDESRHISRALRGLKEDVIMKREGLGRVIQRLQDVCHYEEPIEKNML
ncbi:hypothetical protein QAD02_009080 [Eretmocerus hayati]|uniref:Uncharacterized protein n=1 Tax=Eretmocerus hayati TaxID=131215 RepID=A0ACC2N8M6_9HYME|nr:hypothetical protein QAD02_009080 [Eretmocerus hayati]